MCVCVQERESKRKEAARRKMVERKNAEDEENGESGRDRLRISGDSTHGEAWNGPASCPGWPGGRLVARTEGSCQSAYRHHALYPIK